MVIVSRAVDWGEQELLLSLMLLQSHRKIFVIGDKLAGDSFDVSEIGGCL